MRTWLFVVFLGLAINAQSATHQVIHVDDNAPPGGDGSAAKPYNTIADGVTLARAVGGDPTIKVAPGRYELASTIIIDIPLDLVGSNVMGIDSGGWPTGVLAPGTETRIVGLAPLGVLPLVLVGRPDGAVMVDVNIRGFTFEAGPSGGSDIELKKVQNFSVRSNILTAPFPLPQKKTVIAGIMPAASSGSIVGNYIAGVGCGTCITAGNSGSPASVEFTNNRSVHNLNGGVLLNGSSLGVPDHGDQLDAVVQGNDLSENTDANSFGLRIFVIRRDLPDTQSSGNVHALIRGNRIFGNHIGVSIDAGFPYRQVNFPTPSDPPVCDTRVYTGTLDITLTGNTLSGSLLTAGLISFTRYTATINPSQLPSWQYLHNATYIINDPQGSLAGYLIDNPINNPSFPPPSYSGMVVCAVDTTNQPLGNTLEYNGVPATQ